MNYYFLLEDSKSLPKILPVWLDFIDFGCTRVQTIKNIRNNNYIIESGHGITQLETQAIFETIDTIIDNATVIDKLVIIVDAEDVGFNERKNRIFNKIFEKYPPQEIPCSINIFVCNRCLETWLLGCKGIYPLDKNDVSEHFSQHYDFYDIENNDPEKMTKPMCFNKSVASYHFQYLHSLTQDIARKKHNWKLTYRKNSAGCVLYQEYFNAMLERISDTRDIASFKEFYDYIISERQYNKS